MTARHRDHPPQMLMRLLPAAQSGAQAHQVANALCLVASLLRRRPETAEELLAHVASFVRSEAGCPRLLVTLAEELSRVMALVGIERARLGGRLRIEVRCAPETMELLLPSLVLQPLVENAIAHGVALRPSGGSVRVSSRRSGHLLHLAVCDDGPGLRREGAPPAVAPGQEGFGIAGVRLRIAALCGSCARLRVLSRPGIGTLAALTLPVARAEEERP